MKIAILDDYQDVARSYADWSEIDRHAEVVIFNNQANQYLVEAAGRRDGTN